MSVWTWTNLPKYQTGKRKEVLVRSGGVTSGEGRVGVSCDQPTEDVSAQIPSLVKYGSGEITR